MKKIQLYTVGVVFLFSFAFVQATWAADPSVTINRGESSTRNRFVTLQLTPPAASHYVRISNESDLTGKEWQPFVSQQNWALSTGSGTKTVYVQFRERNGLVSSVVSDSIVLNLPATTTMSFSINNGALQTNSRYVQLNLNYSEGVETVAVSNSPTFSESSTLVQRTLDWVLPSGSGNKTVYVRFTDSYGNTKVLSQTIKYNEPNRVIKEGSVVKGQGDTVYYFGFDGRLHAFLHSSIYHSWFKDFSNIQVVSQAKLREFEVGSPVCMRPGTWLLRFHNSPRVYAVEPGCYLRPIRSEVEAHILFGNDWQKRIMTVDPFYEIFYRVRELSVFSREVDRDRDGIDANQERLYGTSDTRVDSDNDKISDYEEMVYWFSDPALADTDADGGNDGNEIIAKRSPVGYGSLKEVPSGTYEYPLGSIVYNPQNRNYYYRNTNGQYYSYTLKRSIKNKNEDKAIPFLENFIIRPTLLVPFSRAAKSSSIESNFLHYPVTQQGSGFVPQ